ncbi:hypothetical protein BD414DRAFT_120628 [Trametes punicea]|nr:hypothetical protein BD414DRAFT_120628 [Trametes punicea]
MKTAERRAELDGRQDGGPSSSPPPTSSSPPPTSPPPSTTTSSSPSPTSDTPTSTPPDTSSTPPSSSPPPTSSSDTGTVSSNGSGSSSSSAPSASGSSAASSSSQATSTSAAPSTSTETQTVIATNSDGQLYTSVIVTTIVTTPTIDPSNRASSSSSHTGPIVGGVVGGVAGLAILATLLFFLFRARRRRDDFDGNFDPDRVTGDNRATLPDIDLGAGEIEPYNYNPPGMPTPHPTGAPPTGPGPGSGPGMPDMRQYGGQVPSFLAGGLAGAGAGAAMANAAKDGRASSPPSAYAQPSQPYYPPSASDHGYPEYAAYAAYANPYPAPGGGGGGPPSASTPSSPTNTSFGAQAGNVPPTRDFRHPSPGPSLAPTTLTGHTDPSVSGSSTNPGVIPSAKEREAMQYRRPGGLAVANPDGAPPAGSSGVVQHQDAGRLDATPEDEEPSEIPPRYDQIRHDA